MKCHVPSRKIEIAMTHDHSPHAHVTTTTTALDPVCGMTVDPATTPHHADYKGTAFHFCSAGCRTKFIATPLKFFEPTPSTEDAMPAGTIFTCPMHPEIKQVGPGSCPICGMALEPLIAKVDAGPNHELADMTRRL